MRKILKIARLELSILFYSPVAWLVLTIFMIQCGMDFLDKMQSLRTGLSLGYAPEALTRPLFSSNSGLFSVVQGNLYLYLPILTMGLMSREISSGSIKLLLSSPVKLRQIILGKYLAILAYGLCLIFILLIYAIIGCIFIENADFGLVFSGLLGLYLLIGTYAAIGLFMSCLTNYQVVAAISTLAVFAILRFIGSLWQDFDLIRDLTYFLSISGRTEKMIAGMVTTKDIFYYFIIIAFFLSLCIFRMRSERELKPWPVKAARYVLLACSALLLGYLSSRPNFTGYMDMTARNSLTISKNSQDISKQIKGKLKVTTYGNMLAPGLWYVLPKSRNNDLARMEPFQRFIPGMEMDYVYYYQKPLDTNFHEFRYSPHLKNLKNIDQIADKMATTMGVDRSLFISPSDLKKLVDLNPEGNLLVRKLEYDGKSTFLRFFPQDNDPYASEPEVMAALKRLLTKAPKIVFISGNNQRGIDSKADRDYRLIGALKTNRFALVNQGFDIDTVNLNQQEIPEGTAVLVLADPTVRIGEPGQKKLIDYINKGGNMLISGEPGRQHLLNPLLVYLGIKLKEGILIKPGKDITPGFTRASFYSQASSLDSNFSRLQQVEGAVAMQGAAAIEYSDSSNFIITPLLKSAEDGWNKALPESATSIYEPASVDLTNVKTGFEPQKGDQKGPFPVAVSLIRKAAGKEQRLIVTGDADYISNAELMRSKRGDNVYFSSGVFRWLSGGDFPVDVVRPEPEDTDLKISRAQITALMWICKGIIPATIAIAGAIILFKRRRN